MKSLTIINIPNLCTTAKTSQEKSEGRGGGTQAKIICPESVSMSELKKMFDNSEISYAKKYGKKMYKYNCGFSQMVNCIGQFLKASQLDSPDHFCNGFYDLLRNNTVVGTGADEW